MAQTRRSKLPASLQVTFQSLVHWFDDWITQIVMNLVWIFAWVTIVLGPPATFGLFYVESRLIRGESEGVRGMFDGAKRYFFKSWLWMLANLVVIALTLNGILFYGQIEASWGAILRVVMLSILFLWLVVQFYTVPFLIIQEQETLRLAWRNSLFTVLAAPGFTLVVIIFAVLFIGLSVVLIIPLFLGFIPLTAVLASLAVKERVETFRAVMQKAEEKEERES